MATIKLTVRNSKVRQVRGNAGLANDGGSAVLPPQSSVTWQAQGNDEFRVVFFDLAQQAWIFPFDGIDDGVFGPQNAPSLKVTGAGVTKTLKAGAPVDIKYEAYCTTETNADPLDPMMIIRPSSTVSSESLSCVSVGVVSAVIGAAAGALLTVAMLG
jgi:hypothetical protein